MFYDNGVTGALNSDWWKSSSNITVTGSTTGITATNSTSSTYYLAPNKNGTSGSSMSDLVDWNDFICEFTHISHTGTTTIDLRNANGNVAQYSVGNLTEGDKIRIQYTNNTITAYKNETPITFSSSITGDVMIRFAITNGSLTFKEFKVYSI